MAKPWLTDAQLAGPFGTQRIPQVEDLLPAIKAQLTTKPLVQLSGEPIERWRLSPFVWGLQNMADNLEAAARTRADQESLAVAMSDMARKFDVSVDRLSRTVDRAREHLRDAMEDDDSSSSNPGGPPGPPGPPGASAKLDPNDFANALAPLFQDLNTTMFLGNQNILGELQQMRRDGQRPEEDVQYYGSTSPPDPPRGGGSVKTKSAKSTRNVTFKRVEVNNTYYQQPMNATQPEQRPNTGAADDIDMVNPPGRGPPPDPGSDAIRVLVEEGRGFMAEFRDFGNRTARAQEALAEQLMKRDLEAMAERHTSDRDRRVELERITVDLSASAKDTLEKVIPEVARATAAQTMAPDPRIDRLLQLYEETFNRIQHLMQQGFAGNADKHDVMEQLEQARAEQGRLAGQLLAFQEQFRNEQAGWLEQWHTQQAMMEEMRRQVVESKALAENARPRTTSPHAKSELCKPKRSPAPNYQSCWREEEGAHHHSHPAEEPQHMNPTATWRPHSG